MKGYLINRALSYTDVCMRNLIYTYLTLFLFIFFTSCSDKQYQTLFESNNAPKDTSRQTEDLNVDHYKIKSQDLLQIKNLQTNKDIVDLNPQLSATPASTGTSTNSPAQLDGYLVEDDGTVALTGLGRVQVAGLTRVEAQNLIQNLYGKEILRNPIIELKIINLKVTILGEVRTPGNYILTKDKTILVDIIGQAGGLTTNANERSIKIIRGSGKNPKVNVIDLNQLSSISAPEAVLQNGDIIYVAQNRRAARTSNLQNFSVIAQPILLLFNTALIVLTLTRR